MNYKNKLSLIVIAVFMAVIAACSGGPPPVNTTTTTGSTTSTTVATTTTTASTTTTTTTAAPTTTTTTTTTVVPTRPGLPVNESAIPTGSPGINTPWIVPATYSGFPSDGSSQFRTNCSMSHMRWDDPIVRPGVGGGSHLHTFFGNTGVNYASTPESVRTTGNSTCAGGTANRSSYWVPTMVDTRTNNPVNTNTSAIDRENALQVYYKTGYQGIAPGTVQNYPVGLRMIAGDMMSTSAQSRISYECGGPSSPSIPTNCAPGSLLIMSVVFPQCWDGVNLDSPNHKSHMAYGVGWPDKGCPTTHPVPLAEITQNYRYRVPAGGTASWRLSSDTYTGAAGFSGHADWMNGWDPAVFQRIVDNCYHRPGSYDCSMNLLGDGYMLGG